MPVTKLPQIESSNPSPSGDEYFTDSNNLNEIESRMKAYKENKSENEIILHSAEDIRHFINKL